MPLLLFKAKTVDGVGICFEVLLYRYKALPLLWGDVSTFITGAVLIVNMEFLQVRVSDFPGLGNVLSEML